MFHRCRVVLFLSVSTAVTNTITHTSSVSEFATNDWSRIRMLWIVLRSVTTDGLWRSGTMAITFNLPSASVCFNCAVSMSTHSTTHDISVRTKNKKKIKSHVFRTYRIRMHHGLCQCAVKLLHTEQASKRERLALHVSKWHIVLDE